jgi:hypothetical protein
LGGVGKGGGSKAKTSPAKASGRPPNGHGGKVAYPSPKNLTKNLKSYTLRKVGKIAISDISPERVKKMAGSARTLTSLCVNI